MSASRERTRILMFRIAVAGVARGANPRARASCARSLLIRGERARVAVFTPVLP
jgi:hypothetical protein